MGQKQRLGIIRTRGRFYITKSGAWIGTEVPLERIADAVSLGAGSMIRGRRTRIGAGARVVGSYLENAALAEGVTVTDSVLRTQTPRAQWAFHPDSPYRVAATATRIAANATISDFSVLVNVQVGAGASVHSSVVEHSVLGTHTRVEASKVRLVHTEHDVEILGPTEVSQSWLGWGFRVDQEAFVEGVFPNEILLARLVKGRLMVRRVEDVPQAASIGTRVICSGYTGTMQPPADGIVRGITGDESSQHGTPVVAPCAIMAPDLRLIARFGRPNLQRQHALSERDLTYLMPLSVTGHEATEHWGWTLPGERSHGLSPSDSDPAWVFTHSPDLVMWQMRRLQQALPQSDRDRFDELPEQLLHSAIAVSTWLASKEAHRRQYWRAVARAYRRHAASRAWRFRDGKPIGWQRDVQRGVWRHAALPTRHQLTRQDIVGRTVRRGEAPWVTPLRRKLHRGATSVGREVSLGRDVVVGPGVVLAGNTRVTGPAVLWRVSATDAHVDAPGTLLMSSIKQSQLGRGATVVAASVSEVAAQDQLHIAGATAERSELGRRVTIETGGVLRDVWTGDDVSIGSASEASVLWTGFTNHHLASSLRDVTSLEVPVYLGMARAELPNTTNVGAGTAIESADLESAFLASNSQVGADAMIGFASFVKGRVADGAHLLPFTFHEPGVDALGGACEYPETLLRHVLSKSRLAADATLWPWVDRLLVSQLEAALVYLRGNLHSIEFSGRARSPLGYTRQQLVEGIARIEAQMDGRWLLKDGQFTEGVWRFTNGRCTWEPGAWIAAFTRAELRQACHPRTTVRSFSGVRSTFGLGPVDAARRLITAGCARAYFEQIISEAPQHGHAMRLVLVRDPRPTGRELALTVVRAWLVAARRAGLQLDVRDIGVATTPLFEDAIRAFKADGGIMVTASHNPVEQNGFKFATGARPARPGGVGQGALLDAQASQEMLARLDQIMNSSGATLKRYARQLNAVSAEDVRQAIANGAKRERWVVQAKAHYRNTLLLALGLKTMPRTQTPRHRLRRAAKRRGLRVVVDSNGGAAFGVNAPLIHQVLGVEVDELHRLPGEPERCVEPRHEALGAIIEAVRERPGAIGVAHDYDADRGVLVAEHSDGRVQPIDPQQLTALHVAMSLGWAELKGPTGTGRRKRRYAVVVNDATSERIRGIAAHYDAEVHKVEVGEVNLVARAEQLRRAGYTVPFVSEGSNGGAIFAPTHVRDGCLSLLFAVLPLLEPRLMLQWLKKQGVTVTPRQRQHIRSGHLALHEVLDSLPSWTTIQGALSEPQPINMRRLKSIMERQFAARYWNRTRGRFTTAFWRALGHTSTPRSPRYTDYQVVYAQATVSEAPEVIKPSGHAPGRRMGDPAGGWRIELLGSPGRAFIWLRGSRTEPGSKFNVLADAQSARTAKALYQLLMKLYRTAKREITQ